MSKLASSLKRNIAPPVFLIFLAGLFALLLLWLCGTTIYNTISGDDMVFERSYTSLSTLISVPVENYIGWTARLSNMFVLNLIFAITSGTVLVYLTLPLALGLLCFSLWLVFSQILKLTQAHHAELQSFIVSAALTLCLSIYSVTTYDNFYWMAGVVTYILPLIGLCLVATYVMRLSQAESPKAWHYPFTGALTIIVGLFNEAFLIQTLAILMLAVSLFLLLTTLEKKRLPRPKKVYLSIFASILIGLLIAIIIVKVSPGTEYRSQLNESYAPPDFRHDALSLLKMSAKTTLQEMRIFFLYNHSGLALIAALTLLVTIIGRVKLPNIVLAKKTSILLLLLSIATPPVAFFTLALGVHYAYQSAITTYSLVTANFFTYLSLILLSVVIGFYLSNRRGWIRRIVIAIAAIGLAYGIVSATGRVLEIYTTIQLQQKEYVETDRIIKAARSKGVKMVNIGTSERYFTYCVPQESPEAWCNNAYKQFYDTTITADRYVDHETEKRVREGKL